MKRNIATLGAVLVTAALSSTFLMTVATAERSWSRSEITRLCRQMTPQENHVLALEASYFKGGGYNEYYSGKLTLHAKNGHYVLTYPVWDDHLSLAYRSMQQYILRERLKYEMQMLAQMTINGGGAYTDPHTRRPAIRRSSGAVELIRTDLALGSTLR